MATRSEADLTFRRGEALLITFTFTDADDQPVSMAGVEFRFTVRPKVGSSVLTLEKLDAVFNKAQAASGIVTVQMDSDDTDRVGRYVADLKAYVNANDVYKSPVLEIDFEEAVTIG